MNDRQFLSLPYDVSLECFKKECQCSNEVIISNINRQLFLKWFPGINIPLEHNVKMFVDNRNCICIIFAYTNPNFPQIIKVNEKVLRTINDLLF